MNFSERSRMKPLGLVRLRLFPEKEDWKRPDETAIIYTGCAAVQAVEIGASARGIKMPDRGEMRAGREGLMEKALRILDFRSKTGLQRRSKPDVFPFDRL